jgi:hypothetical protein
MVYAVIGVFTVFIVVLIALTYKENIIKKKELNIICNKDR